jgi:hypothetical protein
MRSDDKPKPSELITADDLAKRWGVHRDTIYRLPGTALPYLKLGPNTRRYRLADVLAFENGKRVGVVTSK